jgi:CRISPR-associated endonuclease Cas3-HD
MAAMFHFAHSHKERPKSEWHSLGEHLESTAKRAERFAAPFAKGWGRLAGLLHDAGKYQTSFQDYLAATGEHTGLKVDHSSVGALIAFAKRAAALVFVIAGHHAGLADKEDLRNRLRKKICFRRPATRASRPLLRISQNQPSRVAFQKPRKHYG